MKDNNPWAILRQAVNRQIASGAPVFVEIPAAKPEPFRVTVTWRNDNPDTIWNKLAQRLGREPTTAEAAAEVKRILSTP